MKTYQNVFFSFIFMLLTYSVQSQEYFSLLNSLNPTEAQALQTLVEGINPMLLITDNTVQSVGTGSALVAKCEITSLSKLYENNPLYNTVKLIRIDIFDESDLSNIIKVSDIKGFNSLQYILIFYMFDVCENQSIDCLPTLTNNFLNNEDIENIRVIYRLGIIE
jgi:hypothetical protein